jgi:hypothetical protein
VPVDGRRGHWLDTVDVLRPAEEAENLARGKSGAWGAQSFPPFIMKSLADYLKSGPLTPSRRGEGEADSCELLLAAKVCNRVDVYLEAPKISGKLVLGPQCQLLDLSMPLSPGRVA